MTFPPFVSIEFSEVVPTSDSTQTHPGSVVYNRDSNPPIFTFAGIHPLRGAPRATITPPTAGGAKLGRNNMLTDHVDRGLYLRNLNSLACYPTTLPIKQRNNGCSSSVHAGCGIRPRNAAFPWDFIPVPRQPCVTRMSINRWTVCNPVPIWTRSAVTRHRDVGQIWVECPEGFAA
jgi:hypothetical protein